MKVESVGNGDILAYIHKKSGKGTNAKSLAEQIEKETGRETKVSGENLIVSGIVVPTDTAVVIQNDSVLCLGKEDFESQYREVVEFPADDLDDIKKRLDNLEKLINNKQA